MNWILIGTLLGSTVTSMHESRELCEGRAVILREKGAAVQCTPSLPSYCTVRSDGSLVNCSTTSGTVTLAK